MRDLTPEQAAAIRAYAAQHGRTWKDQLLSDWMRAGSRTYRGEWCYLQQVRNQKGPSWLRSMTLEPATETTDQGENFDPWSRTPQPARHDGAPDEGQGAAGQSSRALREHGIILWQTGTPSG